MAVHSELISTNAGPFAIRDFGGRGPDLLFVHGTGHNLEVWSPLAQALRGCFRMVAFDMRGHGQTPAQSTGPEQYWRDIEVLMAALGLRQPLLVGHSTGAMQSLRMPRPVGPAEASSCWTASRLTDERPQRS